MFTFAGQQRAAGRLKVDGRWSAFGRIYLLAAVLLVLVGFGIRLHDLGGDSLWLDEQLTLQTARLGFPQVLTGAQDHPPLIYFLTYLSLNQFGESEFTARLVSLFAAALGIPLVILFGRVLGRPLAGLWAGLFLCFSPFHLGYAQESRHYALLMSVSLAATILLVQAMKRPQATTWIAYGAASGLNLYVHYGAFIVLGWQAVLIVIWMVWQLWRGRPKRLLWPLLAAAVTLLVYLPWLPRFVGSLERNVGADTISDTGGLAPLEQWLRGAFAAFGMYGRYWPWVIVSLAAMGLLILILQRDGWTLALMATGMGLPFLLIQLGNVARGPYPRYIIYVLPLYLLAAGITPATAAALLDGRGRRRAAAALLMGGAALLFVAFAREPVRREYAHIQDDWRGIVRYLDEQAADGDVILGLSMNFGNGFNTVSSSLPYYLARDAANEYTLLPGNRLRRSSLEKLPAAEGAVWIILHDFPLELEQYVAQGFHPKHFQTHLYVLPNPEQEGSTLQQIIRVYEKMIPLADRPSPACLLEKDLALLYWQVGNFTAAEARLFSALANCNDELVSEYFGYDLQTDAQGIVFEAAVQDYLAKGDEENAARVAGALYELDPHNEAAAEALTLFDLYAAFERSEALVDEEGSIEPVSTMAFVMPQSGDFGQALLVHPPSSVSFTLDLPQEPTRLVTRVAMAPPSWEWGGDGSTFVATVATAGGDVQEIFNHYVSNETEDRRWHEVEIPLDQFAGQQVILTLHTDPGPAGDFSGDWAGWESPRILRAAP